MLIAKCLLAHSEGSLSEASYGYAKFVGTVVAGALMCLLRLHLTPQRKKVKNNTFQPVEFYKHRLRDEGQITPELIATLPSLDSLSSCHDQNALFIGVCRRARSCQPAANWMKDSTGPELFDLGVTVLHLNSDKGFFSHLLSLGLTTTVSIVIAVTLFVVLCLGCVVCYCCRKRSNSDNLNSINTVGITVFNGAIRPISGELGGQHVDPSAFLSGMHKSPEAFQSQMLQHQQQMMNAPGKSMGDLYQQQQLSSNSPMLRHFQNQQLHPNPAVWNMQTVCCPPPPTQPHPPQWCPKQQQIPTQNSQPMAIPSHNQSPLPPPSRISG
ncbi:hypothetical protein ACTXT7_011602 [Hymenolepis weldensis]